MTHSGYKLQILGCGSSPGVPRVGGDWGKCDPTNPKNRRLRCSALIEKFDGEKVTRMLIDTGPDFRQQMLTANIEWVDGVVYTHSHADHLHGIDDLRAFVFNRRERVKIYANNMTMDRIKSAFGYCLETPPGSSYPPILEASIIDHGQQLSIEGPAGTIKSTPFNQIHGDIHSLGYRIGDIAYSSDVSDLEPASIEMLQDLDVWIVDALRYTPHSSHFSLDEVLEWVERLRPKKTILTHMHIDMDYDTLCRTLPLGVTPAYDGLTLSF
ncbi:MBL fold metallo-hydrolase [Cohaesibacter celericrescens]|uniref:Phosphoribosyl 1,2-cyclic phosphodiesterase n=1 Tax=Cohaesibacter celericrescens TaxID=2067669 RepID=A0A2N5XT61_9HYPH|nr:MBL fold metallo-hydrolase [Cohaesibacter celericrescens]PLW77608.1 phosphoribosyl 1,2-cyclic phosphodiesterase [Cohaesibacter celericrescens]